MQESRYFGVYLLFFRRISTRITNTYQAFSRHYLPSQLESCLFSHTHPPIHLVSPFKSDNFPVLSSPISPSILDISERELRSPETDRLNSSLSLTLFHSFLDHFSFTCIQQQRNLEPLISSTHFLLEPRLFLLLSRSLTVRLYISHIDSVLKKENTALGLAPKPRVEFGFSLIETLLGTYIYIFIRT